MSLDIGRSKGFGVTYKEDDKKRCSNFVCGNCWTQRTLLLGSKDGRMNLIYAVCVYLLCIAHKVGKPELNIFCWGNVTGYLIQLLRNIQLELVDDILA